MRSNTPLSPKQNRKISEPFLPQVLRPRKDYIGSAVRRATNVSAAYGVKLPKHIARKIQAAAEKTGHAPVVFTPPVVSRLFPSPPENSKRREIASRKELEKAKNPQRRPSESLSARSAVSARSGSVSCRASFKTQISSVAETGEALPDIGHTSQGSSQECYVPESLPCIEQNDPESPVPGYGTECHDFVTEGKIVALPLPLHTEHLKAADVSSTRRSNYSNCSVNYSESKESYMEKDISSSLPHASENSRREGLKGQGDLGGLPAEECSVLTDMAIVSREPIIDISTEVCTDVKDKPPSDNCAQPVCLPAKLGSSIEESILSTEIEQGLDVYELVTSALKGDLSVAEKLEALVDSEGIVQVAEEHGVRPFVSLCRSKDMCICRAGMRAIAMLGARTYFARQIAQDPSALPLLVLNSRNKDLVSLSVLTAANMITADHDLAKELMLAGFVPVLVDAASKSTDDHCQQLCVQALSTLSCTGSGSRAILESGGLLLLIRFTASWKAPLSQSAIAALSNIALQDMFDLGSASSLVPLLPQLCFSHDAIVAERSMEIIASLSMNEGCRRLVMNAKPMDALLHAIKSPSLRIKEHAARALSCLASDRETCVSLLDQGVLAAAVPLLLLQPSEICSLAAVALANAFQHKDVHMQACDALLSSLLLFTTSKSPTVLYQCARAFLFLSSADPPQVLAYDAGVVMALRRLLLLNKEEQVETRRLAVKAVCELSRTDVFLRPISTLLPAIIEAYHLNISHGQTVRCTALILRNLANCGFTGDP
eukprot:CAMPEP_0184335064 /NCGR_PEP_ID=MMETSP1089-20130417/3687_1 /TAXON_ID=38269 ORGANISM="Gloeochaete wittrockiana, Strain SAG46.84" /NCGR_SAMPLE_ID=MMETSP1089 /ASSEMBLY_ACC=CAM_ASM_000445 /LENGTH=771 /DNA_ID=CAMNT_0026659547 /DNA_START=100 /DNA_END=2412 /DNA_ORIENTATION=+